MKVDDEYDHEMDRGPVQRIGIARNFGPQEACTVDLARDYHSSLATDQSVRFWGSTDLCGAGRSIGVHGAGG